MYVYVTVMIFSKLTHMGTIEYTYNQEQLFLKSTDDELTMGLTFQSCGVNNLYGIEGIKVESGLEKYEVKSCTDWIGPYMVKAQQAESDEYINPYFTGGWHGSNGDCDGEATAETVEVLVQADGYEAKDKGRCKVLTITVINQIKPYNSTNMILKEEIQYQIHQNVINIKVKTTALDEVNIERYFGLQTQNSLWDANIEYLYDQGKSKVVKVDGVSDSGLSKNYPNANSYILTSTSNSFSLKAWINQDNQLTRYNNLSEDMPCIFTLNYQKSYFNLVNGKSLHLNKGESLSWSGGYQFSKKE